MESARGSETRDELNLVDLWRIVWTHKNVLMATLIVAWGLAVTKYLLTEPLYRSNAILKPASEYNLAELDNALTSGQVFKRYLSNFESIANQRSFFVDNELFSAVAQPEEWAENSEEIFERHFATALKLSYDRTSASPPIAKINLSSPNPRRASEWLSLYIAHIQQLTRTEYLTDIQERIGIKIRDLENKITLRKELGKQTRLDQIARWKEALLLAQKLGIRSDTALVAQIENSGGSNLPLYTRGIEALSAELEVLEKRQNDDPFTPGLRETEEQLANLATRVRYAEKVRVMEIDDAPIADNHAFNRSKISMLAWSTFLGTFIGLFLIFAINFAHLVRATSR